MCEISNGIDKQVQAFKAVQKLERELQRTDSVRRILESKRGCTEILNSVHVTYIKQRAI